MRMRIFEMSKISADADADIRNSYNLHQYGIDVHFGEYVWYYYIIKRISSNQIWEFFGNYSYLL